MTNLQTGDLVKLNSGGPTLTVAGVWGDSSNPSVKVSWLNELNEIQEHIFTAAMLTPRVIRERGPIISNPGESYESAARRHLGHLLEQPK